MDKKSRIKIFCIAFALFVAVFTTGTAFAWFTLQTWDLEIVGTSAGAYFAYGDGTEDDPFGITHRIHMSNLAWLQNSGYFDDKNTDDKYYHFELAANIDMWDSTAGRNIVLPPIGNLAHPFKGFFDGHGYTISNLVVSTNKEVLYGMPTNLDVTGHEYAFANAVGLFGMTAEGSEITNFILDQPTVEVSDGLNGARTKYTAVNEKTDPAVVGIAVGYVNGKVHSIGVKGGTLAVRREDTKYTTFNSILGDLSENALKDNNVTGTAGTGTGNNFGANFDVEGVWARLTLIASNNAQSYKLPNIKKDGSGYRLEQLEKMPFTITSESSYDGADAKEVVSPNNIGYILGNLNETYSDSVTFDDPLEMTDNWGGGRGKYTYKNGKTPFATDTIPAWFYWHGKKDSTDGYVEPNQYSSDTLIPLTDGVGGEIDGLPQDIKDILGLELENGKYVSKLRPDENGEYIIDAIQLGGGYDGTFHLSSANNDAKHSNTTRESGWSPHGMIEWGSDKDDSTKAGKYGLAYERDGWAVDENGKYFEGVQSNGIWSWTGKVLDTFVSGKTIPIDEYTGGIALPNNGIWFRPAKVGKIRFIMYSDVDKGGVSLVKIQRDKRYTTEDNPFAVNWSNATWDGTGNISANEKLYILPKNILYYFEFDVQQSDLDAGYEYWMITKQNCDGVKFVYMDIGASAVIDDGVDTDRSDPDKQVTAIDFIYSGVTIAQADKTVTLPDGTTVEVKKGTFVVGDSLYVETRVMLAFKKDGAGAILAFYYRKDDQTSTPLINAAYNSATNELIASSGNSSNATIGTTNRTVTITIEFLDTSPWRP